MGPLRLSVRVNYSLGVVTLCLLRPHEEAYPASNAPEMSGNKITSNGSPVRLRGVATEDAYDLYLEGRSPEAEYRRMATG